MINNIYKIQLYKENSLFWKEFKNWNIWNEVFSGSGIERIIIPKKVKAISCFCFCSCESLVNVEFGINTEIETFDIECFSKTLIESIIVPRKLKLIGNGCFYMCQKLKNIIFEEPSDLLYIGDFVFGYSLIEKFIIPKSIKKVDFKSFSNCKNLKTIEFSEESELKTFSFIDISNVETITIPPKIETLYDGWNRDIKKHLLYLDYEQKLIGTKNGILMSRYKHAIIPSTIKIISS